MERRRITAKWLIKQSMTGLPRCWRADNAPSVVGFAKGFQAAFNQPKGSLKPTKSPPQRHNNETHRTPRRNPTQHHTRSRARPCYPPRHLIQQRQRQYPMRRLFAIQQRRRLRNLPTYRQHSAAHRPPRSLPKTRLGLPLCLRRLWRSPRLLRGRQTPQSQRNPAGKRRNPAQKKLAMHRPSTQHHLPKRRPPRLHAHPYPTTLLLGLPP